MGNRKSKPAAPAPPASPEPTRTDPTPEQREQNRAFLEALAGCAQSVRQEADKQQAEAAPPAEQHQAEEPARVPAEQPVEPAPSGSPPVAEPPHAEDAAPQGTSDADLERLVRVLLRRRPRARTPCCRAPTFESAQALVRLRAYGAEESARKRVRWADAPCA